MELRFILVSHCNFKCYFCLNEYFGSKSTKYTLTPENYGLIASEAYNEAKISKITLTGGEPTLRKDLNKIVENIKKSTNEITLVSNGLILDQKIDALSKIDELHVSFHSFDDDEWNRITGSKGTRGKVQENIAFVRKQLPNLRIKLNVVSEKGNNSKEDIRRYIDFAKVNNLEISVFQEGYFKMVDLLGFDSGENIKPSSWWDLSSFETTLTEKKLRKHVYNVEGVKVGLSYTSTDFISWDSIWVSPNGEMYCNVFQNTPVISLKNAVELKNGSVIRNATNSMVEEARLNVKLSEAKDIEKSMLQNSLANIYFERERKLPIVKSIPVSNLIENDSTI